MATRFFPNYNKNKITSRFGMRTLNGTTRMHQGIDLVAADQSNRSAVDQIKAHTGGTVEAVGYSASAGYYMNIQVSPSTLMVYYHMKELPAQKKGSTVKTGEVIGYMGSTGNSTGAHLHFGIKCNGSWIDPEPYLDKDYTESEGDTFPLKMRMLRKGDRGEDVLALQILLRARGYNGKMNPKLDGIFGDNTEGAVRDFQKAMGLTVDGVAGPETWGCLLGVS